MTRFSVTWEGTCRDNVNLSPSQIVDLLESETSELQSFELNSIHSLAIICDEPIKSTSSPETTNSNTNAMRVVIEEEEEDSNSTLEDISSIDDLNSTTNFSIQSRDSPESRICAGNGDTSGETIEDDDDGGAHPRPFETEEPLVKDVSDPKPIQLALSEKEKNEELGVIIIPDHIVLTVDEKERLFEEFETESTEEVVKIQTVESEDDSKEEISEEKTSEETEGTHEEEDEDASIFENGVLVAEESSTEEEEPISVSIDEQEDKKDLIQYIKTSEDGAREFELELSPDCVEFQSGESDSSSRRASFEDDCNAKLDVKTLDDAFELKPNSPEVTMEVGTEDKNDGWSDSDDEKDGLTVKVKSCESGVKSCGWGQSDDEIEQTTKAKSDRTASVISGDEKSKVMSDGSLCGDIRERGNVIDENRCSSSWNNSKPFQKRNRNDFNDNRNYESRNNQSRDNQGYGQQSRDQGQRDNRHFDKAPGGTNRPRDQNRHGFDRYNRGTRNDDFGRNDDSRRRSFNSDRSFHSYDNRSDNRSGGGDRYGDDQNGQNRNERNHYHRNDHNRRDNRDRDNNFDRNSSSYRRDNNRGYNNGQDSGNNSFGNNYGNNSRPYDNFNQRKSNFFEKENRDSPMSMKGDGQKRSPFNRDEHRRSFRDGGGHHDQGHGGHQRSRDQGDLFGSHDNRNNRRTVRLNPNPSAKITFVNDHCTRGEMDPSDKMRNDLNFNPKEDVENEGW